MVRIVNYHTNIVHIEKNGQVLKDIPVDGEGEEGLTDRTLLNMESIWDFINTVDVEDVKPVLKRQMECNMAIAEEGMKNEYGANIGKVLLAMNGNDVRTRARAYAAAGSDARMNGCELPVIINSGSGNQGITSSVPVIVYAKELGVDEDKLYRALALSDLTTIHQKTPIGRLSAYCGAVSAGAGAGAGIAYLNGADFEDGDPYGMQCRRHYLRNDLRRSESFLRGEDCRVGGTPESWATICIRTASSLSPGTGSSARELRRPCRTWAVWQETE